MTMTERQLIDTHEEYLEHGCTPPQVLVAMANLKTKIADNGHSSCDLGEPKAEWTTEFTKYRWKIVVPVYAKKEPEHAIHQSEATPLHASDRPQPGVREEGGGAPVSGEEVHPGRSPDGQVPKAKAKPDVAPAAHHPV